MNINIYCLIFPFCSQFIYTRKNVSRFLLHQQYLYLSLSLSLSLPLLPSIILFFPCNIRSRYAWVMTSTNSFRSVWIYVRMAGHGRKTQQNLIYTPENKHETWKYHPWKRRNIDPTHPIFWRHPYLFSGGVYCFFSKGQCQSFQLHLEQLNKFDMPRANLQATHMPSSQQIPIRTATRNNPSPSTVPYSTPMCARA